MTLLTHQLFIIDMAFQYMSLGMEASPSSVARTAMEAESLSVEGSTLSSKKLQAKDISVSDRSRVPKNG